MKKPIWWDRYFRQWPKECVDWYEENKSIITSMITEIDEQDCIRKRTFVTPTQKVTFEDTY